MIEEYVNKINIFIDTLKNNVVNMLMNAKCTCPLANSEDSNTGKKFKHYKNNRLYVYLCAASSKARNGDLVVVYCDIESELIYTRPWNSFFSMAALDSAMVPRFEEVDG